MEILEDVDLGEHQLADYDAAGNLIGWQAVTVVWPTASVGSAVRAATCPA